MHYIYLYMFVCRNYNNDYPDPILDGKTKKQKTNRVLEKIKDKERKKKKTQHSKYDL